MSSADPAGPSRWPPPDEVRHCPPRYAYAVAALAPLLLLLALAVPLAAAWDLPRLLDRASRPPTPA